MTLAYHGTRLRAAKDIAYAGAILSPIEVEKRRLQAHFDQYGAPEEPVSLDELATRILRGQYRPDEFDIRAYHVALTTDWHRAKDYALRFEHGGGVIVAVDINLEQVNAIRNGETLFVRERVQLEYLKEIRFPAHEERTTGFTLRKVYATFEPTFVTFKTQTHPLPEETKSI